MKSFKKAFINFCHIIQDVVGFNRIVALNNALARIQTCIVLSSRYTPERLSAGQAVFAKNG
jgi:hypothetical protein